MGEERSGIAGEMGVRWWEGGVHGDRERGVTEALLKTRESNVFIVGYINITL